jgi:hypothetical protein
VNHLTLRSDSDLSARGGFRGFWRFTAAWLCRSFAGFANAADNGLNQVVYPLLLTIVQGAKAKLRFAVWAFAEAHGQLAAQIVLDERGFVPGFLSIPGVGAESSEIAGLAVWAARSGHEILRLFAGRIGYTVEFKPGDRPDIRGSEAFAYGIGKIELHEAGHDPTCDGDALVAWLRSGVCFGGARCGFTRRTGSYSANEVPVFFLVLVSRIVRGLFIVGDLSPIGYAAADDFDGNAAPKLIEAGLGAARLDAKIGLHFRAAVGLDGDSLGLLEELGAAAPERRLEELAAIDPADLSGSGTNFHAVVAASQDVYVVAVVEGIDRLAHLRHTAPKRDAALADVRVAEGFVLGPQQPSRDNDQKEQRHRDQQLTLHCAPPAMRSKTRAIPTLLLAPCVSSDC